MLAIANGPDPGDRGASLTKDGSCIEWYEYEFDGSTFTTSPFRGEITLEGCIEPVPAFVELFEFGSELQVTVAENSLVLEADGFALGFDRTTNDLYDELVFQSTKSDPDVLEFVLTNRNGQTLPSGDPNFPEFRVSVLAQMQTDGSIGYFVSMVNSNAAGRTDCGTFVYGSATGLEQRRPASLAFGQTPPGIELADVGCDRARTDSEWVDIFVGEFQFDYAPSRALIEVNYGDDQRAYFAEVPESANSQSAQAFEEFQARQDVLDATVVADGRTRRFVAVRAWPGSDLEALSEQAASFAPDETYQVVVNECPASAEDYATTLNYMQNKEWADTDSDASVVSAEIATLPFGGQYRSCVVRFFVADLSSPELERIVARVKNTDIPVDVRGIGPGCTVADDLLGFDIDHEWIDISPDGPLRGP